METLAGFPPLDPPLRVTDVEYVQNSIDVKKDFDPKIKHVKNAFLVSYDYLIRRL